jgi:predicted PurR-regulated permease PerM
LVDAIPILGTGTVHVPWGIVSILQGNHIRALGLLCLWGTVSLTRSILEPKLVGKQLGLDPLVTLVALCIGFCQWGIWGMLLAPMAAVFLLRIADFRI